MDAQQLKVRARHVTRPLAGRLAVAWLTIVLAIGLWQGYGRWLLNGSVRDVF